MSMRLGRAQRRLKASHLDLYLVTHLPHIRYLCGFTGSNGLLLVGRRGSELYTDGRYRQQARGEVDGTRTVIPADGDLVAGLSRSPLIAGGRPKIGFQARYLNVATHAALAKKLEGAALLVAVDDLVEPLAAIKDRAEIGLVRRAAAVVDTAFARILDRIRPGVRELEIAAELEYIMVGLGSEGTPFDTICASGRRSALPHGRASVKKIARGDLLTLDFGATVGGYCSDISRTVVVGAASPRQRKIYDVVYRAQKAALHAVRPGASTRKIDEAARGLITRAGYGKRFGHGTGHGIGLEVHQAPAVSFRTDTRLAAGMIITIEPGVYVPGFGGVRIEDDVLVTRSGFEVLTTAPRNLLEV